MRSVPLQRKVHFFILDCTLFAAIAGCDLLQTREPEQPGGSGSTFLPPTSADRVISNLQSAIEEKNTVNYLRCLVDTSFSGKIFHFEPTAETAAQDPTVFVQWSVAMEEQYFKNLSESKTDGFSRLDFFNQSTNIQTEDEVVFDAKYHLVFQHLNTSIAQEARGNLQFSIARDRRGEWSIYRWIDVRDTSVTTWSDFKVRFR